MDNTEWIPHKTKSGKILYYINPATGECKWQRKLHKVHPQEDNKLLCDTDVKPEENDGVSGLCALSKNNERYETVTPSLLSHKRKLEEIQVPSSQELKQISASGGSSVPQELNVSDSKLTDDGTSYQSSPNIVPVLYTRHDNGVKVLNEEEHGVMVDVLAQCKSARVHCVENGAVNMSPPPSKQSCTQSNADSSSSSPEGSPRQILECPECKGQFTCPNRFTSHLRTHPDIDPLQCPLCSKEYSSSTSLTTHLRTHTGEKPFSCLHCQKSFSQSSHLTTHMRVHTGEKPYQCPQCPKTFGQSSHLTLHLRIHNGDKPFQCKFCSKGFSHSSALSTHVRTHTGEKPFQCPHCPKKFGQTSHLKIHVRTHTGERPFQCPHCLKRFRQSCYLAKHVRSHSASEKAVS